MKKKCSEFQVAHFQLFTGKTDVPQSLGQIIRRQIELRESTRLFLGLRSCHIYVEILKRRLVLE